MSPSFPQSSPLASSHGVKARPLPVHEALAQPQCQGHRPRRLQPLRPPPRTCIPTDGDRGTATARGAASCTRCSAPRRAQQPRTRAGCSQRTPGGKKGAPGT